MLGVEPISVRKIGEFGRFRPKQVGPIWKLKKSRSAAEFGSNNTKSHPDKTTIVRK